MIRGSITPYALAGLTLWGGGHAAAQASPPVAGAAKTPKAGASPKAQKAARAPRPPQANSAASQARNLRQRYQNANQEARGSAASQAPAAPGGSVPSSVTAALAAMAGQAAGEGVRSDRRLGPIGQRKVTLETERAEPWDAILNLLRESGVNYVIGGEAVGGRKITARFRDVTLEEALDALADAAGLSYTLRRGIIILTASDPSVPGSVTLYAPYGNGLFGPGSPTPWNAVPGVSNSYPTPPPAPEGSALTEPPSTTVEPSAPPQFSRENSNSLEVVGVRYRPVQEIFELMPRGMAQLSTLSVLTPDARTNSLILGGPPAAVQAAKDILNVLDVPAPEPTTVQVKLHIFARAGSLPQAWFKGTGSPPAQERPGPRIIVLPAGDHLESLVHEIKDSGGVLYSSPVVSTEDNVRAEITLSPATLEFGSGDSQVGQKVTPAPDGKAVKFNLLPRLNADGTINLILSLMVADPFQPSGVSTSDQSNGSDGRWKVVSELERRVGRNDVLAVLKPEGDLQGGSGRNASLLLINAHVEGGAPSLMPSPTPSVPPSP